MHHGIKQVHLRTIRRHLTENCAHIELVCLFGSRATGHFAPTSDVDLVLYGPVSEAEADRLNTCFHESLLPYRVDLLVYDHISHPSLKRRIDAIAQPLFNRQQLIPVSLKQTLYELV